MKLFALRKPAAPSGEYEAPTRTTVARALHELAPQVRTLVFRHMGRRSDAEDVLQEALTEIAAALPVFRGQCTLRTYAYRITLRVIYRALRKSPRDRADIHIVEGAPDLRDPEAIAIHRETLRRLYRALDRLPKKRRMAFVLCAVDRLSHAKAAEIAGVSVETLRARLKHARADLARRLQADPQLSELFAERSQDVE